MKTPDYISSDPTPMPRVLSRAARTTGGAALLLLGLAAWNDWARFLANWLVLFVFLATVGLGALFLVALEFTVNATWSVPLRRIPENLAALVPASLLIGIPLLFALHGLYEWTHADAVAADPILKAKSPYLNVPFFVVRFFAFYAVWIGAYLLLVGGSRKQDRTGDGALTRRAMKIGPPFLALLAFTLTFAAFDWIMSLAPHWYSTILGIYLAAGTMAAGVAVTTLTAVLLKMKGLLPQAIGDDHFYNLGALLFALTTFWAYIAFAQFLLIWYGNLPVETVWFAIRTRGEWLWVSILLAVSGFFVPFLALLSRSAKTNLRRLRWVSGWILAVHALDIYWLVIPGLRSEGAVFGWQELGFPLAVTALGIAVWLRQAARSPLLPVRDPRLEAGLKFHL